ncbi:MAG: DUF2147 domain-containing protein [Pseudomonadota bacterium]
MSGFATAPAAANGHDAAHGFWLTQNGKAIVQIAPCGQRTCGTMVWTANPRDDKGALKRDEQNADAAMRARPICGLQLVGGMKARTSGTWKDGWIYNPRNGETYGAEISAVSPSELKVRGYLGISLLGSSQIWTRVAGDRGGC